MSEIFVENRQVVVPGEVLADGMDYLPGQGAYRSGDSIIANKIGLVSIDGRAIKLISLAGRYLPKEGDIIIAKVKDVGMGSWRMDVNSAYTAMLPVKDATSDFVPKGDDISELMKVGESVLCKITNVTTQKLIDLNMRGPGLHKLPEGQIINVNCNKVPRIIGKQGSMVMMIKEKTGCNVLVGQNGLIWLAGSPQGEVIAVNTIKMIERYAHVSGLTDIIKLHLEKVCEGLNLPAAEELNTNSLRLSSGRGGGSSSGPRRFGGRDNYNQGGQRPRRYNGPPRGARQ
jgi:exosome complex component RRP4